MFKCSMFDILSHFLFPIFLFFAGRYHLCQNNFFISGAWSGLQPDISFEYSEVVSLSLFFFFFFLLCSFFKEMDAMNIA
jgi:hypothetical protein